MGVEGVVGRDYVNAIVTVLSPVLTLCGPTDCSRQVPNITGSDKVEIMQVKKNRRGKECRKKKVDKLTDCTGNR